MKKHDLFIIGSGPGGYVMAIKAAQEGLDVAIAEKESLGGVCLNWGCIPTKALLKSAKVHRLVQDAKQYGITLDADSVEVDFSKIMKRKNRAVKKLTGGVGHLLKKNGVTVYRGFAEAKDAHTIDIEGETVRTDNLVVATGAHPARPPIDGLDEGLDSGYVLTSKEILDLESLPESLLIIGGGVIGVEFATAFNSLGTDVTILEVAEDILPAVDADIREPFKKQLKKDGVTIHTRAQVDRIEEGAVTYTLDGEEHSLSPKHVLLAAGMRPNLKGIEALKLKTDEGGIETDGRLRTSVDGVYAIGDVNGRQLLAHVASKEGLTALADIQGRPASVDYDKMPSGIYTFPEIAQVGLTEAEAKSRGLDYQTSTFPINANGRAVAEGQSVGMAKLITAGSYNEIIGVHLLAEGATEMISEGVLGMTLEGTAADLAEAVHPHPTLSEMLHEIAHGILDKPIHI